MGITASVRIAVGVVVIAMSTLTYPSVAKSQSVPGEGVCYNCVFQFQNGQVVSHGCQNGGSGGTFCRTSVTGNTIRCELEGTCAGGFWPAGLSAEGALIALAADDLREGVFFTLKEVKEGSFSRTTEANGKRFLLNGCGVVIERRYSPKSVAAMRSETAKLSL